MAISNTNVELTFLNVVAAVDIDVNIITFDAAWIRVYYGISRELAVVDTDYTIELTVDDKFTITPLASLITKINAHIVAVPGEVNKIAVRRALPNTTDFLETDGFLRARIAREFDRAAMRFQEIAFRIQNIEDISEDVATSAASAAAAQAAAQAAEDALDAVEAITGLSGITPLGTTLITQATAALMRGVLGLGAAATRADAFFALAAHAHAIADIVGLQAALDAKLPIAGARVAIGAAADADIELQRRRCVKLMNRLQPNAQSYHAAFITQDGQVVVCGQAVSSMGQGTNVQGVTLPRVVTLPAGLLGTPVDVIVTTNNMFILTDLGDVCAVGGNTEGEIGDNTVAVRYVATLLDATDITPRNGLGVARRVITMKTSNPLGVANTTQTIWFVCADGSMWFIGYNGNAQGGNQNGALANALKPTRCLKIANSQAQAITQNTRSVTAFTPIAGAKVMVVAAGGTWLATQPIYGYDLNAPAGAIANWFYGTVTSYVGTNLTINVTDVGSGVASSNWALSQVVDDAKDVYASGGTAASVAYITTADKVRMAGRLQQGCHGLCLTGPGNGVAAMNFPAFRLPKTTGDDASSQLPDAYVCTKVVMGCNAQNDVGSIGLLCADKNLYLAGYGVQGANADGTIVSSANFKKAGSGTGLAATLATHIQDAWCVSSYLPAYVVQTDNGGAYGFGYGGGNTIPGTAGGVNHPFLLPAPFNTGAVKISKVSMSGSFSSVIRDTCAWLANNNNLYTNGWVSFNAGNAPNTLDTLQPWTDPYRGAVTISDIKIGGYATIQGLHVLYANYEVWTANLQSYTNGELGVGDTTGPYMPVRMRF